MPNRLAYEIKPGLKGDAYQLQENVRDFAKSLPGQLYGQSIEVTLVVGDNIIPHRNDSVPNGYLIIYKNAQAIIYDYQKPDRNNLYLNSSRATTIKIVVV